MDKGLHKVLQRAISFYCINVKKVNERESKTAQLTPRGWAQYYMFHPLVCRWDMGLNKKRKCHLEMNDWAGSYNQRISTKIKNSRLNVTDCKWPELNLHVEKEDKRIQWG